MFSTFKARGRTTCPLQHADLTGVLTCCYIDALVGEHHQAQWDVEGHHRAGECIWLVHHEHAHRGVATELPCFYLLRGEVIFMRTQIAHSACKKKISLFLLSVLRFLFFCGFIAIPICKSLAYESCQFVSSRQNLSYHINLKPARP